MKRIYLSRLLPQAHYKDKIPSSELNKFYVLRNTEGNKPVYGINDLRNNLGDHIKDSRYRSGLSMNLVGIYRCKDSRFVVNYKKCPKLKNDWSHSIMPSKPLSISFSFKKNAGYFGFLIADVLNIRKEHTLKNNGIEIGKYVISFIIEHKPTCCNYWHVEFHLLGRNIDSTNESGKLIDLAEKQIITKSQIDKIGGMMTKEFRDILKHRSNIIQYHIQDYIYIN